MKKFFSLVLALVMALSLTTVAWGATTVMDETELKAALAAGGEVVLGADITLTGGSTNGYFEIPATAGTVVLNLNGHNITAGARTDVANRTQYVFDNNADLTIKGTGTINSRGIQNYGKLTIENGVTVKAVDANGGAGIWAYAGSETIINGGTFTAAEAAGCVNSAGKLTINGGTFTQTQSTAAYCYAINFSGTEGVINNATVNGAHGCVAVTAGTMTVKGGSFTTTGVNAQSDHVLYVSAGAKIVVEDGNFVGDHEAGGTSLYNDASTASVTGGSFSDDVSAYVEPGSTVVIAGDTVAKNSDGSVVVNPVAQIGSTKYESLADAVTAAVAGDTIKLLANNTENVAINKSITLDSNGYTFAATAAAGYTMTQNSASTFAVVPVGTSAAGDYKIYANTVAGTLYSTIDVNQGAIFTKVPATAPKMGDNLTWVGGNIEYYVAKDLARNNLYFYEVADKDDATHVIKNGKTVYKYVIMLSDPSEAAYTYTATVSKNTAMNSSDCGKVNVVGWGKKSVLYTYVDSTGLVQFATDDASASANGTIRLNAAGVVDDYYKVNVNPHTFYPTYTKGDVSGATCGKCGLAANRVKSAASLPEKYVLVTGVTCDGEFLGDILYYVPSTASLPSGGVVSGPIVESAETFDAGIAMYVGMSVMAAAGSAVVIGKKKD